METQMKKKLQASENPKNNVFPNLYYIYTFYTNPGTAIKAIILKKRIYYIHVPESVLYIYFLYKSGNNNISYYPKKENNKR